MVLETHTANAKQAHYNPTVRKKQMAKKTARAAPKKVLVTPKQAREDYNKKEGEGEEIVLKRKRRNHSGTVALREIKLYQGKMGTQLLIKKRPFQRLIREIASEYKHDLRFQGSAINAIQESAEQYLTGLFSDVGSLAIHAKRKTIMPEDMRTARAIRNETIKKVIQDPNNPKRFYLVDAEKKL